MADNENNGNSSFTDQLMSVIDILTEKFRNLDGVLPSKTEAQEAKKEKEEKSKTLVGKTFQKRMSLGKSQLGMLIEAADLMSTSFKQVTNTMKASYEHGVRTGSGVDVGIGLPFQLLGIYVGTRLLPTLMQFGSAVMAITDRFFGKEDQYDRDKGSTWLGRQMSRGGDWIEKQLGISDDWDHPDRDRENKTGQKGPAPTARGKLEGQYLDMLLKELEIRFGGRYQQHDLTGIRSAAQAAAAESPFEREKLTIMRDIINELRRKETPRIETNPNMRPVPKPGDWVGGGVGNGGDF